MKYIIALMLTLVLCISNAKAGYGVASNGSWARTNYIDGSCYVADLYWYGWVGCNCSADIYLYDLWGHYNLIATKVPPNYNCSGPPIVFDTLNVTYICLNLYYWNGSSWVYADAFCFTRD